MLVRIYALYQGPIDTAYSFSKAVEYSSYLIMCHHTIVVPVRPRDNLWSFLHPLTYQVWAGILLSVPIFILAMGLANRVFYKDIDWATVSNFVLRVTMGDEGPIESYKLIMNYQKLMAVVWMWAVFIFTQSYAGNLTSMLTRPIPLGTFPTKILYSSVFSRRYVCCSSENMLFL